MTGAQLEAASTALGASRLARPEDSASDPQRRGEFYFATTASFTGISRLWASTPCWRRRTQAARPIWPASIGTTGHATP